MKLLHHSPRPTQLRSNLFPNELQPQTQMQMPNSTIPNPMDLTSPNPAPAGLSPSTASVDPTAPKTFSLLQPDWIELTPYGDFPHPLGLQRIDRLAAERITANFHSFWQKLGRHFAGVPIYIGHPDVPELAADYPDKKAYGWITDLQVRPAGLYAKAKWSDAGKDLIQNAHYKFYSPYWEAAFLGEENRQQVYRPTSLLSLGLTNQPNLPVLPLANSYAPLPSIQPATPLQIINQQPQPPADPLPQSVKSASSVDDLSLSQQLENLKLDNMTTPPPSANPQSFPNSQPENLKPDNMITSHPLATPFSPNSQNLCESASSVVNPSPSSSPSRPNPQSAIPNPQSIIPLANEVLALQTLLYQRDERLLALQNQYDTARSSWVQTQAMLQNKVAALENSRIEIVLDHAVGDGRLAPCERPFWNTQLRRDFDTRYQELQAKPETIHMKSITGNLGKNQIDLTDFPSRQQLLQELVAAKKTAGMTYDQAWAAAKTERPDLFNAMNSTY